MPEPTFHPTEPAFDAASVDALARLGPVRTYPKNTVVFQEGDRSDQLYVVLSGKLKVFLADSDGREVIVDILGPQQYFGELALDGRPRSASVMTLEASKLAIVQRDDFKRFLADNPEAAFGLIVTLIGRARNLTRAVGGMGLLDVYGRVAPAPGPGGRAERPARGAGAHDAPRDRQAGSSPRSYVAFRQSARGPQTPSCRVRERVAPKPSVGSPPPALSFPC